MLLLGSPRTKSKGGRVTGNLDGIGFGRGVIPGTKTTQHGYHNKEAVVHDYASGTASLNIYNKSNPTMNKHVIEAINRLINNRECQYGVIN